MKNEPASGKRKIVVSLKTVLCRINRDLASSRQRIVKVGEIYGLLDMRTWTVDVANGTGYDLHYLAKCECAALEPGETLGY